MKEKFKIEVYHVILDTIKTDLSSRFNDTAVSVLKSQSCLSPAILIEKNKDAPLKMCLVSILKLCVTFTQKIFPVMMM